MAAGSPAALETLRQAIRTDHGFTEDASLSLGISAVDERLGGGLAFGALHEIAPQEPIHLAAAHGFSLALGTRAACRKRTTLLILPDFAVRKGGAPYGAGIDLFGISPRQLLILRVPHEIDVLFAMEEALKCRALSGVIAEITDSHLADLTATRRLSLAAREGGGIGILLRHHASAHPSAAATRWTIAAASGPRDAFGGIGESAFLLSLTKNRRGSCGRWTLTWNHHDETFAGAAHSVGLVAAATDRQNRAPHAAAR